MSEELKACPCCGNADLKITYARDGRQLRCCGCGLFINRHHGPDNDADARLITAWNTRALEDELVKALEEEGKIIAKAQMFLTRYLIPDNRFGSDEAISALLLLFDGPAQREIADLSLKALAKAKAP